MPQHDLWKIILWHYVWGQFLSDQSLNAFKNWSNIGNDNGTDLRRSSQLWLQNICNVCVASPIVTMSHFLTLRPLYTYNAALRCVQPHTMENNDHGNIEVQNILHPIARVACLEANIWCIYLITASPHMWDWSLSTSHCWSMISQSCVGCVQSVTNVNWVHAK